MTQRIEVTAAMLAKLPRWAQEHIEMLTRLKERSDNALQRLEEERVTFSVRDDPPTRLSWEVLMEGAHPLHSQSSVRFYMGDPPNRHNSITFRWREGDQCIDVNASGTLRIQPQASNSVYLTIKER
jgi:hypothetical protein